MTTVDESRSRAVSGAPRGFSALQLLADKPALVLLRELLDGRSRPIELAQRLGPYLRRATLHDRLSRLLAAGAVERHVFAQAPPRVEYGLTAHGRRLLAIALLAAHWEVATGIRTRSEDPREIADALATTAPLAIVAADLTGTCACTIRGTAEDPPAYARIDVRDGRITVIGTDPSRGGSAPEARADGDASSWWDALTTGATASIEIDGDPSLLARALDALRLALIPNQPVGRSAERQSGDPDSSAAPGEQDEPCY